MRQGGDPRLPLELALVKVTRPHGDLSRESLAHRVELLEQRAQGTVSPPAATPGPREGTAPATPAAAAEPSGNGGNGSGVGPPIVLEQLADAWQRGVLDAVRERSIPVASLLGEARPAELSDDTLTVEFPAGADFHRRQVDDPHNLDLLRDALYEVTGRHLAVVLSVAEGKSDAAESADEEQLSGEDVISLLKETLDAREVEEAP
jgi:hypothetical protein